MSSKVGAPTQDQQKSLLNNLARSPDLLMGIAVIGIILMMIFPLPVLFLDFLLACSLSISLIILLISIYVQKPLDFSIFPTILLISTLFRLALNLATTRNILLHGATGDVSVMISAFGKIVIGGNFVVGLVIFIILMIINFIVITKGAGRVAEVTARFTLDAMPGKQMAIDAELNSGHISPDEAKKRRADVEKEADFYGAMDGASKFVRGDAIAGIIITIVNVVVGFVVGTLMYNMSAPQAANQFILFAVGDGLISAIPALMVSTSAGIIITRISSKGLLGKQLVNEIKLHSKTFYIAAGLLFLLSIIPGFPKVSFWTLSVLLIACGRVFNYWQKKKLAEDSEQMKDKDKKDTSDSESDLNNIMHLDILSVEVGHGLISLIDPNQDGEVIDRIQSIRKQIAQELGIIIPQIQLKDNLQIPPNHYQISLKGNKIAIGELMVERLLAMDPGTVELPMTGLPTQDPVYNLQATWISKKDKEEAIFRGYTVVNCSTVIATHITKILKENASELLTRQDVHYLVTKLKETNPKVIDEVLGNDKLSLGDIVKVMQNLLSESVSVRDTLSLFECIADHCKIIKNPDVLSEQCRKVLGRSIVQKLLSDKDELQVVTFDRVIEDILSGGLVTTENGSSYLNLEASQAQSILQKLVESISTFEKDGTQPTLLIGAKLRKPFYSLAKRYIPELQVLSFDEVPDNVKLKNLAMIQ